MNDVSQLPGLPSPVDLLPTDVLVVFRGGVPYRVAMTAISTEAAGGSLLAANNLSDIAAAATARTNLGLGSAAVADSEDFDAAGAGAAAVAGMGATAAGLALLTAADLAAQKTILGIA